jgi:hypothetical protein
MVLACLNPRDAVIRQIRLPDGGFVFVETSPLPDPVDTGVAERIYEDGSLPDGTRLTRSGDGVGMAGELLKAQLTTLAKLATESLKELGPKELQIEAHIKFEGEVKIIPFIAAAKGDGGLKVTMKWVF